MKTTGKMQCRVLCLQAEAPAALPGGIERHGLLTDTFMRRVP